MWDAAQYRKFARERARPFADLLAQVQRQDVRVAVDLGCGPGDMTRTLIERWPAAVVIGVDKSPDMLAQAQAIPGRLSFVQADIESWRPDRRFDLIVSNAALHWVADHERLIPRLLSWLAPGGVLAVQMPAWDEAPCRQAILETVGQPRCSHLARAGLDAQSTHPLNWYVRSLLDLGCAVNAWETTYFHVLEGDNPVLEWFKGSALRAYLLQLDKENQTAFLGDVGERFRQAYPPNGERTVLPLRRCFFVATLPH